MTVDKERQSTGNVRPFPKEGKQKQRQADPHEIPLASAINRGTTMFFVLMNGMELTSTVRGFDKYTVTIEHEGHPMTIFKHSIVLYRAA